MLEKVKLKGREYLVWVTSNPPTRDEFLSPLASELEIREKYFNPSPRQVVIDVGAQYGNYTLDACSLGAKVYAFEPNPESFEILRRNVEVNGFTNCTLLNFGLWSKTDKLLIAGYAPHSDWRGRFRVIALDEWVELNGMTKVDFIKIDTEGAELEILKGGLNTLRRFKPKLLVEVHTFVKETLLPDVEDLMKGLGYSCERIPRPPATMVYATW
ncbi:FkbM family methyltransferase [Patescibacteria group bacterium]|nr:FkbM family methyltransferase [Patescibacteria group bacterium]